MAKLGVQDLLGAGFSEEQIALLVKQGAVTLPKAPVAKVVDYTTRAGKRDMYLKHGRTFVKASEAQSLIEALQAGIKRHAEGKVDEVSKAQSEE